MGKFGVGNAWVLPALFFEQGQKSELLFNWPIAEDTKHGGFDFIAADVVGGYRLSGFIRCAVDGHAGLEAHDDFFLQAAPACRCLGFEAGFQLWRQAQAKGRDFSHSHNRTV